MGICLGMQMLFSNSEEFGSTAGLNLIEGSVKNYHLVIIKNYLILDG